METPRRWARQGGDRMTCDQLVCANCAGPIAEGRCAVCRAHRERLHHENSFGALTPAMLIALLVVLAAVVLVVHEAALVVH